MPPLDGHVHSEWSWDAEDGSMERTCARAAELGLAGLAFTEHADLTAGWAVLASDLEDYPHLQEFVFAERPRGDPVGGTLRPPWPDVDGYLGFVQLCREQFPELRILSGIELGEPHRDADAVDRLLEGGGFERVVGSLHSLPDGDGFSEMPNLFRQRRPADVVRDYLVEVIALVEGSEAFSVLGHIDYALRYWPKTAEPFDVQVFEAEFRDALRALANTGRVLEVNTSGPFPPQIVYWWREEGGATLSFGSDAHEPAGLARRFREAVAKVEAAGFHPREGSDGLWTT